MFKKSLLVVALFISFQVSAQKYIGDKQEIDQILNNIKAFSQSVITSDYEGIAEAYTEDGKIFPNNSDIVEGKSKIKKWWVLPEGVKTTYHKIIPAEIRINGEYAYDHGLYEGNTLRANGREYPFKGKYVIVWKKENGSWKIYLDIWNSTKK